MELVGDWSFDPKNVRFEGTVARTGVCAYACMGTRGTESSARERTGSLADGETGSGEKSRSSRSGDKKLIRDPTWGQEIALKEIFRSRRLSERRERMMRAPE